MAHEQLAFGESERIDVSSASLISYIFLVFCYVIIVSCIYHICRFLMRMVFITFIQDGNSDFVIKLSVEVQELMSEVENSKEVVEIASSLTDEVSRSFSDLIDVFLVSTLEIYCENYF